METTAATQMKCLELAGGRVNCQRLYELPGFSLRVFSRTASGTQGGAQQGAQGGGEVHYISSCASGRITRLLLADICGSAETFERLAGAMRKGLLRNINSIWQNRVVTNMHRQLDAFAQEGGFATASVSTYFAPTGSFSMCNAGNPAPLLYRAATRQWQVLKGETKQAPAGGKNCEGVYGLEEYRYFHTKLRRDDLVVTYGNGFSQSKLPDGGYVGQTELRARLQDTPHSDQYARLTHLIGLIQSQSVGLDEDNTVVVTHATGKRVSLRNTLLAPFRLLRRPRDCSQVI